MDACVVLCDTIAKPVSREESEHSSSRLIREVDGIFIVYKKRISPGKTDIMFGTILTSKQAHQRRQQCPITILSIYHYLLIF